MILLCTATSIEARACAQGTARARSRFEILQTGMGLLRAEKTLRARLTSGPKPSLIVSTGFAGSWSPAYAVGTWVLGKNVAFENQSIALEPAVFPELPRANFRSLARASSGSGDLLVDLESFAWAKLAREEGIPFAILRMVSDTPADPLPEAIIAFSSGALLQGVRGVLTEPRAFARFIARGTRLPGLLKEGWNRFSSTSSAI